MYKQKYYKKDLKHHVKPYHAILRIGNTHHLSTAVKRLTSARRIDQDSNVMYVSIESQLHAVFKSIINLNTFHVSLIYRLT